MELERYIPQATVSKLADRPKMTAEDLKRKFDEAEKDIAEYLNDKLVPKIEGEFKNKSSDITDLENKVKTVGDKCKQLSSDLIYHVLPNEENPHNVTASQIPADKDLISPPGTVGEALYRHEDSISGLEQANEESEKTFNKSYEIDSDSTHDTYPSSKAVWDAIKSNAEIEVVTITDISEGTSSHTFEQMKDAHNKGKLILVTAYEMIEDKDEFGHVQYEPRQIPATGIATFYLDEYGDDWFDATLSTGLKIYRCTIQDGYGDLWDVGSAVGVLDSSIVDNLDSSKTNAPLSANQGRVLNEKIGDIDKALEDIIKIQNQLMGVSK